jgi:hypothetical protein
MLRLPASRVLTAALAALSIGACAGTARTSLDQSWVDPKLTGTKFRKVLILSVAGDEFAQAYFQESMAAALTRRGMNAIASERYFTHRSPAEDARFKRAVESSGADAVLLARVVGVDEKSGMTPGMLVGPNGVPYGDAIGIYGAMAQAFAPTLYAPPTDWSTTTVIVETLLYEMQGKRAVWSARTSTRNDASGDLKPAVQQFVDVLVGAMSRDGLF